MKKITMGCDRETISREQMLEIPSRKWDDVFETALVYVYPNGKIHDSGFMCMDFVAKKPDGEKVRFGCWCDSVAFRGSHFNMECMQDGTIRIFNPYGFEVSPDVSTIIFEEREGGK